MQRRHPPRRRGFDPAPRRPPAARPHPHTAAAIDDAAGLVSLVRFVGLAVVPRNSPR